MPAPQKNARPGRLTALLRRAGGTGRVVGQVGRLRRPWGEAVNLVVCGWRLSTGEGLLHGLPWASPFLEVILRCAGRDCLRLAHACDGHGLSLRIADGRIVRPISKYKNSGSGGQDARPPQEMAGPPPKKKVRAGVARFP